MDDPSTNHIDGFTEENPLRFEFFSYYNSSSIKIEQAVNLVGDNSYQALGTWIGELKGKAYLPGMNRDDKFQLYIVPNPVKNSAKIMFELEEESIVGIELFDMQGKSEVLVKKSNYSIGHHEVDLNAKQLRPGIYFIKSTFTSKNESYKLTTKFVKL